MQGVGFGTFLEPFSEYPFWIPFRSILDHLGDPLETQKAANKSHQQKRKEKELKEEPVLAKEQEARSNVKTLSRACSN